MVALSSYEVEYIVGALSVSSYLAYKFIVGSEDQSEQACEADDWQKISHKPCQKSGDAWKKQAYWHRVSFFEESGS